MGTSWSEIISDHAMVFIDDVRLTDQAAESHLRVPQTPAKPHT